jgi:lipid-A-disaccharide synthase
MIIAGEDSADQYAGRLIEALQRHRPGLQFFGIGGKNMREAGVSILFSTDETSIMGFAEVVTHIGLIRRMFKRCEEELLRRKPSAVVLIDYPGFNLRFAKKVKEAGIPVIYYISPQVWAWGKNRTKKMAPLVDHLAVVFPFEEEIFLKEGIPTTFVGHPLLEILEHSERHDFIKKHNLPDKRILALLPGSRKQEIERMLPPMLEATRILARDHDFVTAIGVADLALDRYTAHLGNYQDVSLLSNATHGLMQHAFAALVTSGTATVETAFYETPMAVAYKTSTINYAIGKRLVNVDNIAMVNILAGKRIVPELVQHEVSPHTLADAIRPAFEDPTYYANTVEELKIIKEQMGSVGTSERVAEIVLSYIS